MDDDALVEELWREVRPNQLAVLHGLVDDVTAVAEGRADAAAWGRVREAAHRLAGTLGSFGQRPAGEAALALEDVVTGVEDPPADVVTRAVSLAEALHAALPHDAAECPRSA